MRILKRIGIGLAGVVVLAAALLYGGSQWVIRRSYAEPLPSIAVPTDPAQIAEGARLAKVMGCRGCHGPNGEGKVMFEDPMVGRLAAPALADVAARYSNEELARAVHQGVRRDGSTLWIMPSSAHAHIADEDLGRIIAWIRTLKRTSRDLADGGVRFGPVGRLAVLGGGIPPSAHGEHIAPARRPGEIGRYYVESACSDCHALDKERPAPDGDYMAPALAPIAAAYDRKAFRTLLRTGIGADGKDKRLMGEVSRDGFVAMTDAEIDAVQDYLKRVYEKQAGGR